MNRYEKSCSHIYSLYFIGNCLMFHFVFSFPQQNNIKSHPYSIVPFGQLRLRKTTNYYVTVKKRRPDIVLMFASTLIIHTYYVFLLFFLHSLDDKR